MWRCSLVLGISAMQRTETGSSLSVSVKGWLLFRGAECLRRWELNLARRGVESQQAAPLRLHCFLLLLFSALWQATVFSKVLGLLLCLSALCVLGLPLLWLKHQCWVTLQLLLCFSSRETPAWVQPWSSLLWEESGELPVTPTWLPLATFSKKVERTLPKEGAGSAKH